MKTEISASRARVIAFYLPQYHPIPENNKWWGAGFTEWTNVTKAKPLFKGHYQPHLPADLGFYDLRVQETRIAQAEMAYNYGIEGFCYWHYWFSGKRLLERPFTEVLNSKEPNFPFCLGWANDSWTGIWHNCPDRILIEQNYQGDDDYKSHFLSLLDAFFDDRYIKINEKPVFVIYRPSNLPDPKHFTDYWRELADQAGLKGIYFIGNSDEFMWDHHKYGFDAYLIHNPGFCFSRLNGFTLPLADKICRYLTHKNVKDLCRGIVSKPIVFQYEDFIISAAEYFSQKLMQYPCIVPNWDNTPRSGKNGVVLADSHPELFHKHFEEAVQQIANREYDNRIIFVKSWNEWAEGNHLEPDQKYGKSFLKIIRDVVKSI